MGALQELANRMVDGKTVGFVGAGASVRCGYPLWSQLLDGLYEQALTLSGGGLHQRQANEDLRWLAEYYSAALRSKIALPDAVDNVFNAKELTAPGEFHELLARLPFSQFVTTNYDDLLEDACNEHSKRLLGRDLKIQEKTPTLNGLEDAAFTRFLRSLTDSASQRSVLHLHGALRLKHITLALSDYSDQYMQEAMPDRIYTIFTTSTVVFIGTSLTDADIMALILRSNFHGDQKARHFAFLPSGAEQYDDVLKHNYGIDPIRYQLPGPNGWHDHSNLERKLSRLLELVEERQLRVHPDLARVKGNTQPLASAPVDTDRLEEIKDGIRSKPSGLLTFSHPSAIAAGRLLRRVAADYRALPARYRFRRVVWLSPKRLGVFPHHAGPRRIIDAVMGEITRAMGHHSITSTLDHRSNIRALRDLLTRDERKDRGEVTLFIIDDAPTIYAGGLKEDLQLINDIITNLPRYSLGLFEYTSPHGEGETPRWETRRWQGIWDRVELGEGPTDWPEDVAALLDDALAEHTPNVEAVRTVLSAVSVPATPTTSEELTAWIGMSPLEIEETVAALAHPDPRQRIIETEIPPAMVNGAPVAPEGGVGVLDITPPMRWAFLRRACPQDPEYDAGLRRTLEHTASRMFEWAAKTTFSLEDWEHDTLQGQMLNRVLPDLLSIYEAASWLADTAPEGQPGIVSVEERVRFGIQLSYILFSTGRWAEGVQYAHHLAGLAPSVELAADVQILRSRMLAFADQEHLVALRSGGKLPKAMAVVTPEGDDPSERFPDLDHSLPLHRQLARRAAVRRGVIHLRSGQLGKARRVLESVYRESWNDGHGDEDHMSGEGNGKLISAELIVRAETAGWLVEVELAELARRGSLLADGKPAAADPKVVHDLLAKMDRQRYALGQREDQRQIGHHWRLRGQVLIDGGWPDLARRYFCRALLTSYEFRDRLLEASARLGIAQCDRRRDQAERAAETFEALRLLDARDKALNIAQTLPELDRYARLRRDGFPKLVIFPGPSASGKSTALRTAARTLTRWGLDPIRAHGADLAEVAKAVDACTDHTNDPERAHRRVVVATLPLAPGERFEVGGGHDLPGTLCVNMIPQPRPEQHNWVQPAAWGPPPHNPTDAEDLGEDSRLELDGIASSCINSNVPILEFQSAVTDALRLSYLSVEELLDQNRHLWT